MEDFIEWLIEEGHLSHYGPTTQLDCEFSAGELDCLYEQYTRETGGD
ncbi:MAG: hypothetical protein HOG49_28750 [Candidatus Scalindua sp.]|jgi:hypothetical protein|nr:hypothetical protein [Candidatus Scalindua sp.]